MSAGTCEGLPGWVGPGVLSGDRLSALGVLGLLEGLSRWPVWVAGGAVGLSVFLTALAIKTLDDLLDEPEQVVAVVPCLRAVAYLSLALVLGAGVAPTVTVSLFLCAYAVGMAPTLGERLPSGVASWVESLAVVGVSAFLTGPRETAGSLLLVAGVQALDDFRDWQRDRAEGRANLGLAVGRWPTLGLGVLLVGGAAMFSLPKMLAGLAATVALVFATRPASVPELAWVEDPVAAGRKGGLARGALRLGLAAAGLAATVLGALGTALESLWLGPDRSSGSGALSVPGGGVVDWSATLLALLAAGLATAGVLAAFRRGLAVGLKRGRAAARAARPLELRADVLDGASDKDDGLR